MRRPCRSDRPSGAGAERLRTGSGVRCPHPAAAPRPSAAAPAPAAPPVADGDAITMPFGDLTVSEGRLVKWYRRPGDAVAAGEHVADIETDKAVVEIESP